MTACLKAAALLALVATAAGQSLVNLNNLTSPARRSTTNSTPNLYQAPCGSGDGAGGETVYYLDILPGWG